MPRSWLAGWQNPRNNEPAIYVNTSDTWNKGLCTKQISDFPQTASRKLDFYYNLRRRKVSDVEKSRAAHHFLSTTCPILATAGNWRGGRWGGVGGGGVEWGWSRRGERKLRRKLLSTLFFLTKIIQYHCCLLQPTTVIAINIWKLKRKVLIVLRPKSAELEQNFARTF